MRIGFAMAFSLFALVLLGCASQPQPAAQQPNSNQPKEDKMEIKITSAAFNEGQLIPRQYTCDGMNLSPPLEWIGVPKNAMTLAIICDDPDAPSGTWVHWMLYNLPAERIGLIENVPPTEKVPGGGVQGTNDFRKIGYGGPCPPRGTHRYFFKIYALDGELSLKAGVTKAELLKAMEGHTLAQGQLMGTYSR
jgi:Raf kinase inhibitor-like YbhB/YbcL family protein